MHWAQDRSVSLFLWYASLGCLERNLLDLNNCRCILQVVSALIHCQDIACDTQAASFLSSPSPYDDTYLATFLSLCSAVIVATATAACSLAARKWRSWSVVLSLFSWAAAVESCGWVELGQAVVWGDWEWWAFCELSSVIFRVWAAKLLVWVQK